jgi:VanZ family protein
VERLGHLISSIVLNIYIIYPLSRIWWYFLGGLALWTLLGVTAALTGKAIPWRRLNGGIAVVYMALLVYMTVASRSESAHVGVILRPFYSFYLAREVNPEYYREMLMNVLLFFPLGLTIPFGLSARRFPVLWALAAAMLLSVFIETLQYMFSLGLAETDDIIMNTLGVLAGSAPYVIVSAVERLRKPGSKHRQDDTHGE